MSKRNNFSESAMLNNRAYIYYKNRLTELAISMFEWKNLPDTVDERFMELTLFKDGKALFFNDEELGHLCLQCTMNGGFDVYRIPIRRRAYSANGYNRELDKSNSVIIYNNYMHTNCVDAIEMFARRLYDIDRTIDINARGQKTPVIVQCSEQQRLTLVNLYKEYDGNSPVIYADKNLDINGLKSIPTLSPYVGDKLYQLKTEIWNEALTYLGISNINIQKKERLIQDEVTRNQGGTIASRYPRLQSRREACEKINKMFGLNIEVNYREDFQQVTDGFVTAGMDTIGGVGNE